MTKFQYIKFLTKALFSKTKKWELQTGHTVEIAFYSGGEPFYQLSDTFNTYVERGLEAYQVYEEILMRVGVNDLKVFVAKFKELCNSNPIQILEVSRVLNFLEERVNFVVPPSELVWKMASVKYFSKDDSPYSFEPAKAKKNVKKWRENGDVSDFFLCQQLENMIPLPKLSKEICEMLLGTANKIVKHQSELMNISGNSSETSDGSSLYSERESVQNT